MNNNQPPPEKQCKCHCHTHGILREECMEYQDCYGKTCAHCQPHQDEGMDWEEEIRYLFNNGGTNPPYAKSHIQYSDSKYPNQPTEELVIKTINSLLAKDRQQLRERIREMRKKENFEHLYGNYNLAIDDILTLLK